MTATQTEIKERPLLMNTQMVRAVLDGRKTQTRRIVRFDPPWTLHKWWPVMEAARDGMPIFWSSAPTDHVRESHYYDTGMPCPYGLPGERLWIRETWSPDHAAFYPNFPKVYRADGDLLEIENGKVYSPEQNGWYPFRWRPSIHMPRWACRLLLDITAVTVHRVQDISEADALAEGCFKLPATGRITDVKGGQYFGRVWHTARAWFRDLWNSLYAKPQPKKSNGHIVRYESYPWSEEDRDPRESIIGRPHICNPNPYVWAITFERSAQETESND